GQTRDDAVARLTDLKLVFDIHDIASSKPAGTVIAQKPDAGARVIEKTRVRINVSSGPKPITVPDVRGSSFESASSQLQALGFAVAPPKNVQSDQAAAGIVIGQEPAANSSAAKGSTITLTVSKGPQTTGVPKVVNTVEH